MTWEPIDQDQSQDDEVCGVQLGADLLRNLNDDINERHSGGSRHWTARAAYSTPSDVWRSIPFAVPIYEGVETLRVAMRYEAAIGSAIAGTDAVDVRLVCNGNQGAITTLTVTSVVTNVELSCSVVNKTRGWAWAAIQVRSKRSASATITIQPQEQVTGGTIQGQLNLGTLSTGRVHYELVINRNDQLLAGSAFYPPLHVSRIYDFGGTPNVYWFQHWPHVPDGATYDNVAETQNDAAELFDLGTLEPYGISWWWTSGSGEFIDAGAWLLQHGPLATVKPSSVQQLDSFARTLLKRPLIFGTGPRGDQGGVAADNGDRKVGYTATGSGDNLRIARFMAVYDDETRGIRLAMMLGSIASVLPYECTLTITFRADDTTSLGTDTFTPRVGPVSGVGTVTAMTQIDQPAASYAAYVFLARDPYNHGSGDLVGAEEYRPASVIGDVSSPAAFVTRDVVWPAGITDGDTVYIDVTTDTALHAWGATCVEWR